MAIPQDVKRAILAVNSGSSSLKISLFQMNGENGPLERVLDASVEEIYTSPRVCLNGVLQSLASCGISNISTAFSCLHQLLQEQPQGQEVFNRLAAVGHRVVHGGEYNCSQIITEGVLKEVDSLADLAPLHNPACLQGIYAARQAFGSHLRQVAVFDTAFHQTMPPCAATYGIPCDLAHKHRIKKYGFHGIAHAYLWDLYQKSQRQACRHKIITLHLGSGCSMAAIEGGVSVDTTMGFTPLEGLLMATRCGDLDPAVVEFLCIRENKSVGEIVRLLNFESGLLGLSGGVSKEMRILLSQAENSSEVRLAIEVFKYRIQKYIGAFQNILKGADALVFSGGIGENSWILRQQIADELKWQGIYLDPAANCQATKLKPGDLQMISAAHSSLKVYAAGCDENHYIAEQALALAD